MPTEAMDTTLPIPPTNIAPQIARNRSSVARCLIARPASPRDLPLACLSDLQDPGAIRPKASALGFGPEPSRWLVERLVRQVERTEVHRDDAPRMRVDAYLKRLLRGGMHELHDGSRTIGTDRHGGEVDRTEALAELRELR